MTPTTTNRQRAPFRFRPAEQAQGRTVLLLVVALMVGAVIGAALFYRPARSGAANGHRGGDSSLSDATKDVLSRLKEPVEVRFFSLLGPTNTPELLNFAGRADQLLAAYAQAAGGKVRLIRYEGQSPDNQNAAREAGLRPFNADEVQASYLGVVMVCGGQKESLPLLSPEWEQALESDLTRALLRLSNRTSGAAPAAEPAPAAGAATEDIKRLIPNPDSVSLAEGARIIHNANLDEFKATAQKMESQIKEARERLSQAQAGGSEAARQAAMKELQLLQAEQMEKLRQIAARSQAQLEALRALKATNP